MREMNQLRDKRTAVLFLGVTLLVVLGTLLVLYKYLGVLTFPYPTSEAAPRRKVSEVRVLNSKDEKLNTEIDEMVKGSEDSKLEESIKQENQINLNDIE